MLGPFARVLQELRRRSLLQDLSNEGFANHMTALLRKGRAPSVYAGFDPTGPSLHLGHLAVVMALSRLQQAGMRPIALVRSPSRAWPRSLVDNTHPP
jgi:tyrosyl-tRNA synthetase